MVASVPETVGSLIILLPVKNKTPEILGLDNDLLVKVWTEVNCTISELVIVAIFVAVVVQWMRLL